MGQTEQPIQHVRSFTELKQVRDWDKKKKAQLSSSPTTGSATTELGTNRPEWPAGEISAEKQMLVEANSKPHDVLIYTEGSVKRAQYGWGFTVKQGEELNTKTAVKTWSRFSA